MRFTLDAQTPVREDRLTRHPRSGQCVLIRQNATDRILEKRDYLELQINLLAEREATRSLRILQRVAKRLNVDDEDCEPDELACETSAQEIAKEIRALEADEERIHT